MRLYRTMAVLGLLTLLPAVISAGCQRQGAPPPPTPEQVKVGVEQTAERIRNDPKLTPQQKEQAIRALYGMAGGIRTQGSGKP